MESELAAHLRTLAKAFAVARSFEISTVGRVAAGDWRFFDRLDDPTKTFTLRKYDEVVRWFSDNWPENAAWPDEVPRPGASSSPASGPEAAEVH